MKLETITAPSREIYLEHEDGAVIVNTWSNLEGVNVMLHGKGEGQPLHMAGALRWSEVDALIAALAAARTA